MLTRIFCGHFNSFTIAEIKYPIQGMQDAFHEVFPKGFELHIFTEIKIMPYVYFKLSI